MSHNLFTKAPTLRAALRRAQPQLQTASYHSTSSPKMPSGHQHLRTLIRQTTLRASTTTLQRTSYPVSQHFHTAPPRSRTPSPPPPYQTRGLTLCAPTDHWTRFNTPYTLSSIRTFTSTRPVKLASEAPAGSSIPPETLAQIDAVIEQISDMYGTAKDEFEIASEESEKNTTYAPDDRAAAREELDRLVEYYNGVLQGDRVVAEEVKRRVGGRIRELVAGVERMEEEAMHGD
ncbi:hypothetical protein HBI48_038480 [Parastagonospora nodorum]|nr:hypothetical protein HBI48_038480 [Parastagonospora nodorum]